MDITVPTDCAHGIVEDVVADAAVEVATDAFGVDEDAVGLVPDKTRIMRHYNYGPHFDVRFLRLLIWCCYRVLTVVAEGLCFI